MSRVHGDSLNLITSFPRSRGDEPKQMAEGDDLTLFSPLTRG